MRVIVAHGGTVGLLIEATVVGVPLAAIALLRRAGRERERRRLEAEAAARRAARARRRARA